MVVRGLKRRSIDFSVRPVPSCFSDRVCSKISLRTTTTTVPSKADPMAISGPESQSQPQPPAVNMVSTTTGQTEVEFAKCDCCGLTEECTPAYITRIRERHQGRWICGLCSEAVKEEIRRSAERLIGMDEALTRHMSFCNKFSSAVPVNPTVHLISAMRQVLRRSLDSPRFVRSTPNSPRIGRGGGGGEDEQVEDDTTRRPLLARSESCFSTLTN